MADKIYIDTQLLEELSLEITQLKNSLTQVSSRVSSSLSEVRRVASSQTGTIGRMSKAQQNLGLTVRHADALAKAVGLAADLWEKAEKRIASQRPPESDGSLQGQGGVDVPWWAHGWGTVTHSGSIGDLTWQYQHVDWGDLLRNPLYFVCPPWSGASAIMGSIAEDGFGGMLYKLATGKLNSEGALLSGEVGYGGFFLKGGLFGGEFKSKGQAAWDLSKGEAGIKGSIKQEMYLAQLEGGYKGKYGELTSKGTVGGAAATGEVGLTLFSEGKFDPALYGKVKGEAYVYKSEVSGKLGTDDLNIYASKESTLLGAEGEVKVGFDDGKLSAKAGGEAYLAKGEIKGGINLFGIKIGATGEVMVGVNGTAGAEVGADGAEGEIGLGPVKVKLNIDWSEFAKKYL